MKEARIELETLRASPAKRGSDGLAVSPVGDGKSAGIRRITTQLVNNQLPFLLRLPFLPISHKPHTTWRTAFHH